MKSTKRFLCVMLAAAMLIPCIPAAVVSADAASGTLAKQYATNPDNKVGVKKTISVDGSISDWDSSMLIAQGAANDDPRVYRENSMYEIPIDMYGMYACWDDNNLYLMWEMTNVQDVVAPNDDYPLSQGLIYKYLNAPFYIAVDTGKDDVVGNHGKLSTGGTLWDSNISIDENYNRIIATSYNAANGPFVYSGDSTGLNAKEIYNKTTAGITLNYGTGILNDKVNGINGGYGTNHNRVVGDVCNNDADWVEFNELGHSSSTMDFHFEMSIPLTTLGITSSDITNNGIGVMNIATMGLSGMDCLPYDTAMNDNADLPDTRSQEFNSFEKSDEDVVTAPFARVGKASGVTPTQPTTAKPTTQPTTAQPTTAQPTTAQPTTAQPTTVKPTTQPTTQVAPSSLTVNATSNLFPSESLQLNKDSKTATVSYDLKSAMKLVNGQWTLSYDSSKLSFDPAKNQNIMPYVTDALTNATTGTIKGNFTNATNLYDFTSSKEFVTVTFDVLGTGSADVNLDVQELSVGYISNSKLNYANAVSNSKVNDLSTTTGFTSSSLGVATKVTADEPTTTQPVTTQPTTTQPVTTQPTTTQPATQPTTEPVGDDLNVNATSNIFDTVSKTFNKDDNTVTVTYNLKSNYKLIDGQWTLYYDNTKLAFDKNKNVDADGNLTIMKNTMSGSVLNTNLVSKIKGNFTSLGLYDFSTEKDFVTVTFDIIGKGTTDINLDVEFLSVAKKSGTGITNVPIIKSSKLQSLSGTEFSDAKISGTTVLTTAEPEPILGDVDGDGYITVSDSSELVKYAVGKKSLSEAAIIRGDVNFDGVADVNDATLIQKYLAGFIDSFE